MPLHSVNIVDDDINLNQIKRSEDDDEKYAPKEELPTIVGKSKDVAKLKASSWRTVETAATKRQSSESDEDYDLSTLRGNKRVSRKHSDDSDLDVRRKRKNEDSDSDIEVQRRRKRDNSDTEVQRRRKQRADSDSDVDVKRRRKPRDDSDSDLDVKRRRTDNHSSDVRNGSRFNNREDHRLRDSAYPKEYPKDSQPSKHRSRDVGSTRDSYPSKHDQHEPRRRAGDDRPRDCRRDEERSREERRAKQREDKPKESKRQRSVQKEESGVSKETKVGKKSKQSSKSRSKSIDADTKKKRKSKERKSRSSSKPSKSRSKSVEIKKERQSISRHRSKEPKSSSKLNESKSGRHEDDERVRSKHRKRKSEDSEKSGKSQRKSKHRKDKSSKERSPKVKKINEISDSDEEDIREKIRNLYKTEAKADQAEDDELQAKYKRWGKGLKQIEEKQKRLQEEEYEMSKPLARYKDDEDLDEHLREQELVDDPMLEYFRQRKQDKDHQEQFEQTGEIWALPKYECKMPPPVNRFNIWPGYRWDGVDRSNQWEQKILAKKAEKTANQEESYKYSSADM